MIESGERSLMWGRPWKLRGRTLRFGLIQIAGGGIRTHNLVPEERILGPQSNRRKSAPILSLHRQTPASSPICPTDAKSFPLDLAAVVEAWPDLPESVRASISMLVKAAKGNR